jgi:hypothetical protein
VPFIAFARRLIDSAELCPLIMCLGFIVERPHKKPSLFLSNRKRPPTRPVNSIVNCSFIGIKDQIPIAKGSETLTPFLKSTGIAPNGQVTPSND